MNVALPATVSGSLSGFGNDFTGSTANGCTGAQSLDRMYRVTIPAGQRFTAALTPSSSDFDPALSLVLASVGCTGSAVSCAAAADVGNSGQSETLTWQNTTGATVDAFLIVEKYGTSSTGTSFSMSLSSSAPPAGDTCGTALTGSSGVTVTQNVSSFGNDYAGSGSACVAYPSGADFVIAYQVPNNRSLTVTASPAAGLDVALNFAASVQACDARSCLTGINSAGSGGAETVGWNNTSGVTQTVYVVVDAASGGSGTVSVVGTEGALLGCGPTTCASGCCSAGQCVTGTSNAACGTGGAACTSCSSPALCNANRVCSATRLPTGSACTAAGQCYDPVIGDPECRTSWPGGYCTSVCLFTQQACGGIGTGADGWCTDVGECLGRCSSPGGGQSSCRSGYVCDSSPGLLTGGVCVPRCQTVACAAGTCNAAGYCR